VLRALAPLLGSIPCDRFGSLLHQSPMRENTGTHSLTTLRDFIGSKSPSLVVPLLLGLGMGACSATADPAVSGDNTGGSGGTVAGTGGTGATGGTGISGSGTGGGAGGTLSTDPDAGGG